ncbi:MAG: glutamate--tRNA ligase [Thiotrichales bacterium]
MPAPTIKARFAPSPTGFLHLGNIRTALFNALLARKHGGVFLLRIEDTDPERSKLEYQIALQEDLRWLGLDWHEGPEIGGAHAPYNQSERGPIYTDYAQQLIAQDLAYPCFCSDVELKMVRKRQLAAGQPPRYAGTCARLSEAERAERLAQGKAPTLRFRVPKGTLVEFDDLVRGHQVYKSDDIGDFIIRRSDGSPAFFFTNAIDDALMGVSHVLRGEDHLTNTPRQLLIYRALGLPEPQFGHISLIVSDEQNPLSKREGSLSVRALREEGYLAGALVNHLARLGHAYEVGEFMDPDNLAHHFELNRLGKSPARHDHQQLLHWQHEAVMQASIDDLIAWLGDFNLNPVPAADRDAFVRMVQPNLMFPTDVTQWTNALYSPSLELEAEAQRILVETGPEYFAAARRLVAAHVGDYRAFIEALKTETGRKGKQLFMPIRVALTGRTSGPELEPLFNFMSEQRLLQRLAVE